MFVPKQSFLSSSLLPVLTSQWVYSYWLVPVSDGRYPHNSADLWLYDIYLVKILFLFKHIQHVKLGLNIYLYNV